MDPSIKANMAQYPFAYGHETLSLDLPQDLRLDWIEPAFVKAADDPTAVIRQAILNPVDGQTLADFVAAKKRGLAGSAAPLNAVIAINDKTRPVPHEILLPPLLAELHAAGIPPAAVTFLIATGTHIPMQADEFDRILPREIFERYSVVSHNSDLEAGLELCGTTSRGTEVWANRLFRAAAVKILVGNIEPHHFAGFSGGYKSASIGLTARRTINHNHAMLAEPGSEIAVFDGNPLRQDIEEIGELIGVDFALNAILNGEKKIVSAVFGHPRAVIRAGIPLSQQVCQIAAPGRYDLVIASAGGAPKDINFYQSQKALTHASLFTRDGGVIILVAENPEGTGSRAYEEFMQGVGSFDEVYAKFRALGFRVGPHKAFQVARIAGRVRVIMVSAIPAQVVTGLLMTPASSLPEAFEKACALLAPTSLPELRIAGLPRATNTIPV
jgi:lactate racemase